MKQNKMRLVYDRPAPAIDDFIEYSTYAENGWERYSLPLGNGFFGANVFGRLGTERVQISDPTLANPYYIPKTMPRRCSCASGVNSMAELLFDFGHEGAQDYETSLSLDDAIHTVRYTYGGVSYVRECFTSHPDRVFVMRVLADKEGSVSFSVRNVIPFVGEYNVEPGDGMGKSGEVIVSGSDITARGRMEYYGILYENKLRVLSSGGRVEEKDGCITVSKADSAVVIFTCATNYELSSRVFMEAEHERKLAGNPAPTELVNSIIDNATERGYDALLRAHLDDYHALFDRVKLSFYEDVPCLTTDALLACYKRGVRSPYLEILLYHYGRYLMISASRTLLPTHLQGIWNAYSDSPWSCGYWHNINIQMNYWSTGSANLSELFVPYINYAKAYMPLAEQHADRYIAESYPEKLSPSGGNGWIVGTGGWPYKIDGFNSRSHSGPGTGAFTALLFWDYYDYTRDVEFLRDFGYPALRSMSVLYSKALIKRDGVYLVEHSASPEIEHNGTYYHTVGCAFDQQMVYECFRRTIDSANILGVRDQFIAEIESILPHLEPVLIGDDGQVKEFREETYYGSIGDPHHRHISHLVGLYPGTVINEQHPEWIKAAEVTLNRRGDKSHCWAVAHRMLLWARCGNGKRAMDLLKSLIQNNVMENLWDWHPPFQIDGNFGYTAGVGEMLVGGADGIVRILPALPPEWQNGEFSGIVSRGGISFDCKWCDGKITYLAAKAKEETSVELRFSAPFGQYSDALMPLKLKAGEFKVIYKFDEKDETSKTRLEIAHHKWHSTVAKLVSPPYTGSPEEFEVIKPLVEKAQDDFCVELLQDADEAIEFLSRNRLEVENFFGDLMRKFDSNEIYDALYNYYARNFPSRSRAEIEEILKIKCDIQRRK